jgi:ABC-type Na+ efflux pump permease subunit
MNQYALALLIVMVCLAVFAGITTIAVKLKTKGKDETKALEKVDTGLDYAQAVAVAISPFLPKIAGPIIMKVLTTAKKGVEHVEGTYKAAISVDPNSADTRKAEATSLIKSALALDGIADTPEVDKLIDVVIPLLVLALPKTHTTTVESGAVASGTTGAV